MVEEQVLWEVAAWQSRLIAGHDLRQQVWRLIGPGKGGKGDGRSAKPTLLQASVFLKQR